MSQLIFRERNLIELLLLVSCMLPLLAQEQPPVNQSVVKQEPYLLLIIPSFVREAHAHPFLESKKTLWVPALENKEGCLPYSTENFEKLRVGHDTFMKLAMKSADQVFLRHKAEVIEDDMKNPSYMVVRSGARMASTLLFSPALQKQATELFKGKVVAIIPDQQTLYLFAIEGKALPVVASQLLERYEQAVYPASKEIIALPFDKDPMKVIGTIDP